MATNQIASDNTWNNMISTVLYSWWKTHAPWALQPRNHVRVVPTATNCR
jgi:hypothetical protein